MRAEKPGQIRLRLSAGYEAEETLTYTLSVRVVPVWAPFAVFAGMILLICALIRICQGKNKKTVNRMGLPQGTKLGAKNGFQIDGYDLFQILQLCWRQLLYAAHQRIIRGRFIRMSK